MGPQCKTIRGSVFDFTKLLILSMNSCVKTYRLLDLAGEDMNLKVLGTPVTLSEWETVTFHGTLLSTSTEENFVDGKRGDLRSCGLVHDPAEEWGQSGYPPLVHQVKHTHVVWQRFFFLWCDWPDWAIGPTGDMQGDRDGDGTLGTQRGHGSLGLGLITRGFDPGAAQVRQLIELDAVLLWRSGAARCWTCFWDKDTWPDCLLRKPKLTWVSFFLFFLFVSLLKSMWQR